MNSRLKISATGSGIIPFNCTTGPVDGAPSGNVTSCEIDTDVVLKGKLLNEDPLPAYSIEDPLPLPDGCTISSILNPRWAFSAFEVDRTTLAASNDSKSSAISFNVILQTSNRGFQFPISISQGAPIKDSSWYSCVIGESGGEGQILWPSKCSLQYNPASNELLLDAEWLCSYLDPDHP